MADSKLDMLNVLLILTLSRRGMDGFKDLILIFLNSDRARRKWRMWRAWAF